MEETTKIRIRRILKILRKYLVIVISTIMIEKIISSLYDRILENIKLKKQKNKP